MYFLLDRLGKRNERGLDKIYFLKYGNETAVFDEQELAKVEEYWGAFLTGNWSTNLEIVPGTDNCQAW